MRFRNVFAILAILLVAEAAMAHARLTGPAPRNNNAGIKNGPCGGLLRSATPTMVQGGQQMTVTWQETINHPGKYIFSWSTGNDQAFTVLKQVIDVENATNNLPHNYTTTVLIPDVACETCTLQMIQSMEENPAAPTFYYSCADIRVIPSSGTVTTTNPVFNQSNSNTTTTSNFGGGCGLIKPSDKGGGNAAQSLLFILIPAMAFVFLRRRSNNS